MKKILWIFVFVIVIVGIGAFELFRHAPQIADRQIQAYIHKNCKSCDLHVKRIGFGLFPAYVDFQGIQFRGGSAEVTQYLASIESVRFDFSFKKVLSGRWDIRQIQVQGADVVINDGDGYSKKSATSDAQEGQIFRVGQVIVRNGSLAYHRFYKQTHAIIHLDDIQASIDEFGNAPGLRDRWVEMKVNARLEKSGHVYLQTRSPFFEHPPKVDVYMKLAGQDLDRLTPFFKENAGVTLRGHLYEGESMLAVRDNHLSGWVLVKYDQFHLGFIRNFERSGFSSFFMNLGTSIGMDKKNADETVADQRRHVEMNREKKQTLVSFILQGMKQGALKVTLARKK